jgi:hypothetical protein
MDDLTDEEAKALKRILVMVTKKPSEKIVISQKDVGTLTAVLGKLDSRPLTIREARELRKAQDDKAKKAG